MNEAAATIAGELGAERNQSVPVPVDDGSERLDHEKRSDLRVLQHGPGGVAEPEPADHDIEVAARELVQSQPGQRDLRCGEQARHQIVFAELDLEDIDAEPQLATAAQAQRADRRRSIVQLLEQRAHPVLFLCSGFARVAIQMPCRAPRAASARTMTSSTRKPALRSRRAKLGAGPEDHTASTPPGLSAAWAALNPARS